MAKTFFTNVSRKAVEGIRNLYAGTGAEVSVIFDPQTGEFTVVVVHPTKEAVAA